MPLRVYESVSASLCVCVCTLQVIMLLLTSSTSRELLYAPSNIHPSILCHSLVNDVLVGSMTGVCCLVFFLVVCMFVKLFEYKYECGKSCVGA